MLGSSANCINIGRNFHSIPDSPNVEFIHRVYSKSINEMKLSSPLSASKAKIISSNNYFTQTKFMNDPLQVLKDHKNQLFENFISCLINKHSKIKKKLF